MAIERAVTDGPPGTPGTGLEIEIVEPEAVSIQTEDGGMVIDFRPEAERDKAEDFNANLAEFMDESALGLLGSELFSSYQSDKSSRKDWEESYTKGLDQLGTKITERTEPWDGACGVTHPLLSEAVVRFQSQAVGEIFPASGPVKTKIIGQITDQKMKQAHRLQNYMNYLVLDVMTEYRSETEKLLFSLPLAGSAFKKVYWDPNLGRPSSMFVPSQDLVASYGSSSLETCPRITHVMKRNKNDLRKMQFSGFYRDIDLGEPAQTVGDIQKKEDTLTGESDNWELDGRYTILEMHVDLDLEGYEDVQDGEETGIGLPYVVTLESGSNAILSIRRNWIEGDKNHLRRNHFVHYEYVPGLGFYGFGLIHFIGGLAKSATSLLRQLVDAGTLSNLPGGLKSKGLRIIGDDTPIRPGEFRDVDVLGSAIRDNITFLPYKEPSPVLYQLMGNIVEEGRRFASLTDLQISDMNQQAPVGTTLALMERSMKVMAAIQSRLHAAMKKEFKILSEIVKDHCPHDYPYDLDGDEVMKSDDFDDRLDVIPVSDPTSATMAQRIMENQAAVQLSATAPQLYNLPALHRQMLEVLGIQDVEKIIPLEDEIPARGPVQENMDILMGEPVKAFLWQDHEAHITSHMAASQDPKMQEILSKSPTAQTVQAAGMAHVTEHLAFQYRKEIEQELGVTLPPPDEPLPADVEVQLSKVTAEASTRLLQKHQSEVQQAKAQEQQQDPILQMRQRELAIREQETQAKIETDKQRLMLDTAKAAGRTQVEQERIESQERVAGAKIGVELSENVAERSAKQVIDDAKIGIDAAKLLLKDSELDSKAEIEGIKIGAKLSEKAQDRQAERERDQVIEDDE
ncbi:hypothetical protein CMI37_28350 [Candidatus Pacearchaeota archaeon]|nr:hypothetical protein [Candidatus Pacearchaeota archaeon]